MRIHIFLFKILDSIHLEQLKRRFQVESWLLINFFYFFKNDNFNLFLYKVYTFIYIIFQENPLIYLTLTLMMMMMVVVEQQLAKLSSGSLTGIWTQYSSEQTHNVHRMHTQFRSHIIQCMDPTTTILYMMRNGPSHQLCRKITIFYTEIFRRKVDLQSFFMRERSEKIH